MTRQRRLEMAAAAAQQAHGRGDGAHGLAELGLPDSPFLTVPEAARLLRFDAYAKDPAKACRDYLAGLGVPAKRRGRILLYDRRVLLELALQTA